MMQSLQTLYEENRDALDLSWIAGDRQLPRLLPDTAVQSVQASELVGHLNLIHPKRIHVVGAAEVAYVERMSVSRQMHFAHELAGGGLLGLIVAESLTMPESLLSASANADLPVLASPRPSAEVIDVLRIYLAKALAPHCSMHGVFM